METNLLKIERDKQTPKAVLKRLMEGNKQFANSKKFTDQNFDLQIRQTAAGQYPYAIVLSCIDSRVPAEIIFNQGIGDIFSARVAGNVLSDDIVGSIEFACKVAGVKLIVIMGHTSCGAVIGACDDVALGKITGLVNKIRPAVQTIQKKRPDENSTHKEFVAAVAKQNVENVKEALTSESLVIRKMVGNGEIEIVGAMYDVENGQVYFDR